MLKIKLARFGKKGQPHFRIVVTEAKSKRDGKYVSLLGHYAPAQQPKTLEVDVVAYKKWVSQGAQPTPTVASLIKRFESGTPFPEKPKKPSKKQVAKEKAAQEAANAPVVETPIVEATPEVVEVAAPEAAAEVVATPEETTPAETEASA